MTLIHLHLHLHTTGSHWLEELKRERGQPPPPRSIQQEKQEKEHLKERTINTATHRYSDVWEHTILTSRRHCSSWCPVESATRRGKKRKRINEKLDSLQWPNVLAFATDSRAALGIAIEPLKCNSLNQHWRHLAPALLTAFCWSILTSLNFCNSSTFPSFIFFANKKSLLHQITSKLTWLTTFHLTTFAIKSNFQLGSAIGALMWEFAQLFVRFISSCVTHKWCSIWQLFCNIFCPLYGYLYLHFLLTFHPIVSDSSARAGAALHSTETILLTHLILLLHFLTIGGKMLLIVTFLLFSKRMFM